jgi:hypothetical protein
VLSFVHQEGFVEECGSGLQQEKQRTRKHQEPGGTDIPTKDNVS